MEDTIRAPYFDGSQPCAQVGGDVWFPESFGETRYNRVFLDRICDSCPFKKSCFEYAVTHSVEGYWAGTTEPERKRYRSKHNIATIPYAYNIPYVNKKLQNAEDI